jgi:ABC-type transport system involved in multi-copper enzyme maturation permease subunit
MNPAGFRPSTIAVIAWNTFREAVRDRVLYNLVFFALLMISAAVLVGQISIGIERLIIVNLGLTAVSIFGVVMAVFLGVGLVHKEIERRTLYVMLAKPVRRWEFIAGKYFGLCLTLTVNTLFMTVGLAVALLYVDRALRVSDAPVLVGVFFILLQLLLITGIALAFSCFATPVVATLGSLGLYVVGVFSEDIRTFGAMAKDPMMQHLTTFLYYVLPNFGQFNVISAVAHEQTIPGALVAGNVAYTVLYVTITLIAAAAIFSNRNMK